MRNCINVYAFISGERDHPRSAVHYNHNDDANNNSHLISYYSLGGRDHSGTAVYYNHNDYAILIVLSYNHISQVDEIIQEALFNIMNNDDSL